MIALGLAALAVLIAFGCSTFRRGYESAPYTVARTDGRFQVRQYPGLVMVQTARGDANNSFMRLFRFIGGKNAATRKIPMTTPVFMAGDGTNATMSFVMPKTMRAEDVPQPSEQGVAVASMEAGRYAVLGFTGSRSLQNESNATARLATWMTKEGLSPAGEPIFGYFDPPWTPPFLRRNEVMIRIAPPR